MTAVLVQNVGILKVIQIELNPFLSLKTSLNIFIFN